MTTFFKKFASETHICSASSDSRLCKRQNRHLRLPQTHVDVNRRILTKKINFPASRSGDFNGATPSIYLFTWFLVIIISLNYSIATSIATDKTQPPSPCSKMGNAVSGRAKTSHGPCQSPRAAQLQVRPDPAAPTILSAPPEVPRPVLSGAPRHHQPETAHSTPTWAVHECTRWYRGMAHW
jgi:hypothetical protein